MCRTTSLCSTVVISDKAESDDSASVDYRAQKLVRHIFGVVDDAFSPGMRNKRHAFANTKHVFDCVRSRVCEVDAHADLTDLVLLNRGGDNGGGITGGLTNLAGVREKITGWSVQVLGRAITSLSKVQQPGLMKHGLRAAGIPNPCTAAPW